MRENEDISVLVGKTLVSVEKIGTDELRFVASDGTKYRMYHDRDCSERVSIEDITGDLEELVGSPIVRAEESCNHDDPKLEREDFWTWTFYRIATAKGLVVIRWYGESNGYYSESVSFERVEEEDE